MPDEITCIYHTIPAPINIDLLVARREEACIFRDWKRSSTTTTILYIIYATKARSYALTTLGYHEMLVRKSNNGTSYAQCYLKMTDPEK